MVASKGNLQCEMCHLDGISTKSSLKRHQRFYCKGAVDVTPQQPLPTDVKVVAVSKEGMDFFVFFASRSLTHSEPRSAPLAEMPILFSWRL